MNSNEFGGLYRLIDANLNRLKEGIRVVEDICRFVLDNGEIAKELKTLRHLSTLLDDESQKYLQFRNIAGDPLKESLHQIENQRTTLQDLITSNLKRGQESARVLEEAFKLIDIEKSEKYKLIRYRLYDIELRLFNNLI